MGEIDSMDGKVGSVVKVDCVELTFDMGMASLRWFAFVSFCSPMLKFVYGGFKRSTTVFRMG